MQVWPEIGSFQAAAPDTTGTLRSGLMLSSQAQTLTCLVVCQRNTKLLQRQHASASESASSVNSVPGQGWDAAPAVTLEELEFTKRADEWTASINSHSVLPPRFRSLWLWELRPPMTDEGIPGGALFC